MSRIQELEDRLRDKSEEEVFRFSDELAEIGSEEVIMHMLQLLDEKDEELVYLAARTLAQIAHNSSALDPLLDRIHDPAYTHVQGTLVEALTGFDVSDCFVDLLRVYLFGNFKASGIAKSMLDYSEFTITERVLRKAEKHWNHYQHNAGQDPKEDEKRREVPEILADLRAFLG